MSGSAGRQTPSQHRPRAATCTPPQLVGSPEGVSGARQQVALDGAAVEAHFAVRQDDGILR